MTDENIETIVNKPKSQFDERLTLNQAQRDEMNSSYTSSMMIFLGHEGVPTPYLDELCRKPIADENKLIHFERGDRKNYQATISINMSGLEEPGHSEFNYDATLTEQQRDDAMVGYVPPHKHPFLVQPGEEIDKSPKYLSTDLPKNRLTFKEDE